MKENSETQKILENSNSYFDDDTSLRIASAWCVCGHPKEKHSETDSWCLNVGTCSCGHLKVCFCRKFENNTLVVQ